MVKIKWIGPGNNWMVLVNGVSVYSGNYINAFFRVMYYEEFPGEAMHHVI